jgi:hypothetical protein
MPPHEPLPLKPAKPSQFRFSAEILVLESLLWANARGTTPCHTSISRSNIYADIRGADVFMELAKGLEPPTV